VVKLRETEKSVFVRSLEDPKKEAHFPLSETRWSKFNAHSKVGLLEVPTWLLDDRDW